MDISDDIFLLKNSFFFDAIIQLLHSARKEILLINFLFSDSKKVFLPFIDLFKKLSRSGVKISIVLNGTFKQTKASFPNRRIKDLLDPTYAKVLITSSNKVEHRKIVLIDRKIVVIGSHNFTRNSFKINRELSVCIRSQELAEEIIDICANDYPSIFRASYL